MNHLKLKIVRFKGYGYVVERFELSGQRRVLELAVKICEERPKMNLGDVLTLAIHKYLGRKLSSDKAA